MKAPGIWCFEFVWNLDFDHWSFRAFASAFLPPGEGCPAIPDFPKKWLAEEFRGEYNVPNS
jgi:hypothetical protein